jgi:hypothetical protein
MDLSGNKLSGVIPSNWRKLSDRIVTLKLSRNAGLSGCVPLTANTAVSYDGTSIVEGGLCKTDGATIEEKQRNALRRYLPQLLGNGVDQAYKNVLQDMVKQTDRIGSLMQPGQTSTVLVELSVANPENTVFVYVSLIDGAEQVTRIDARYAGLDLTAMVPLARALPKWNHFTCTACSASKPTGPDDPKLMLPPDLPDVLPECVLEVACIRDACMYWARRPQGFDSHPIFLLLPTLRSGSRSSTAGTATCRALCHQAMAALPS